MFPVANGALLAKCLKALKDELYVKILRLLEDGPAACTDLARRLRCHRLTVRKRLENLREAGFVLRQARQGEKGRALYVVCAEKVRALFDLNAAMARLGILPG